MHKVGERLHKHLQALVEALNKHPDFYADDLDPDFGPGSLYGRDTYLLRYDMFGPPDEKNNRESLGLDMVVMGDFGITWEPSGYTDTEQYGEIDGEDVESDVEAMVEAAQALLAECGEDGD